MSSQKENEKDTLGARLKKYEADWNEKPLNKDLPLYVRLDGRHFSTLTSGMRYPYNDLPAEKYGTFLKDLMMTVALRLAEEFKPDVTETHSDEISMGWKTAASAPFEGRYFKIISNMASYAGALFYKWAVNMSYHADDLETLSDAKRIIQSNNVPSFDCRAFQVPDIMELVNCFVWRQNDCIRGTINQYAQRWFSPKQLHGKSIEDRLKMLRETGHEGYLDSVDFEHLKHGTWFRRVVKTLPMPEEFKNFHPGETTITRHVIEEIFVDRLGPMSAEEKISAVLGNSES